jgi:hypothetical protein
VRRADARSGDVGVVVLHGHRREHVADIAITRGPTTPIGQLHAHEQLRDRDSRDSDVIVVLDQRIELFSMPLRIDQEGRVED